MRAWSATIGVRELPSAGSHLDLVVALQPIDERGDQPAGGKDADDQVADGAEILVERANEIPEPSLKVEIVGDQAQGLDAAHEKGYRDGNRRDGHVVEQLAD